MIHPYPERTVRLGAALFVLSWPPSHLGETPTDIKGELNEQAKMKQEADAKKAATAKMTPEQKAAARKPRQAEAHKYESRIEKITQNPGASRNMGINKSAAASKAGPTPPRGTINTPEAEKLMLKQKVSSFVKIPLRKA